MCRTRHFRSKGQCATEIQLLNTPHDRRCCCGRQAMTPLWCSSINTLWFPQKLSRARSGPGVGATAILATKITWWHGNADGDCSDSSFNLLLISRILVGTNGNGRHHVIIGINHRKVCVVDINSLVGCLAAGRSLGLRPRDCPARRDNSLGSWCQQHTPIHD